MKCHYCGEELGVGDVYDLMSSHVWSCKSKVANDFVSAKEQETQGRVWEVE